MALSKNFELGNFASGLDVNNSTGAVTTINLNSTAITEGSNLYYTDARVSTFLSGGSLASITTSGNITVGGNLVVNGSTTTINSTTLDVDDINITVAKGAANANAANGAGLTIDGANATLTYVSASDRFEMNKSLATNLIGTVSDISNHLLDEDNFATDSATKVPSQQSVKAYIASQIATKDNSDEITEGSTNLYFTNERVDDRVAALIVGGANITATYNDAAGTLTIDGAAGYTTSSFNTDFAAKTTSDLSEGTNLYYTNARADQRATLRITAADIGNLNNVDTTGVANAKILKYNSSTSKWEVADDAGGIALTSLSVGSEATASGDGGIAYNSSTGVFTYTPPLLSGLTGTTDNINEGSSNLYYTDARFDTRLGTKTTANLSEGSNLYYTDARVQTYLGGGSATTLVTSGNVTIGGDLTVNGATTTISTTNTVVEDSLIELSTGTSGTPANDSGIVIERGSDPNAFIGFDESANKFIVGTGSFTGASTGNLTITTGTLLANIEGNVTGNVTGTVSSLSNQNTDALSEGSSNLYYTTSRQNSDFDTRLATKNTGALTEGSNLYYTDARVKASTMTAGSLRGALNNATVYYGSSFSGTPVTGSFFFDSLNSKLKVYTGSAFVDAVPAGGGGGGGSTDANTTFRNHTYDISGSVNSVSGKDSIVVTAGSFVVGYKYEIISAGNTSFTGIGASNNNVGTQFTATGAGSGTGTAGHVLNYSTTGNQNVVVFRNGVKQVEGASDDYVATSGTSVNFTYNLVNSDVIDIQIYELLTGTAYYTKSETYTQAQVNTQITTAIGGNLTPTGLTVDTSTLVVDASNNRVGIGTATPFTRAVVGGGSGTEVLTIFSGSNGEGQIRFADATSGTGSYQGRVEYDHVNGKLNLGAGGATPFTIDSSGKVGIGEASPQRSVVVKGANSTTTSIQFQTPATGSAASDGFGVGYDSNGKGFIWNYESSDTYIGGTTSGTAVTVVGSSGNVGIGTDAPDQALQVKGIIETQASNSTNGWMMYTYTDNTFRLNYNGVGNDEITVLSNGNVGIGNTNPGQKLTVSGGIESTNSQGSVAFYATTAGSYNQQNGSGGTAWAYGSTGGTSSPATSASTTFGFHHWNGSAWSNPLNIKTDGKVGIGEDNPLVKLDLGLTSPSDQVIALRQNGVSRTTLGLTANYGVRVAGPSDAAATGAVFEVGQNLASDGTTYQNTRLSVLYNGIVHVPDTSRLIVGSTLSNATSLSSVFKNSLQQYTVMGSTLTSVTHPGSASSTKYYIYDRATVSDKINLPLEVFFPNGVSNLAIRLYYNDYSLWVSGEAITGSTYSNAAAMGFRRYSFSHNYNGATNYQNVLNNTENVGVNSSHMEFNSHGYDANESGGAHYFEFRHIQSTGNTLYLQFQLHGSGKAYKTGTWYYKMTTY